MLEFVSLFLGLTFGIHPVELVVADPRVARIELRLDDRQVADLVAKPWRAELDFGILAPHRLEAIAYDSEARELARAEQWINVPRAPAEARLLLEKSPAGGAPRFARLTWESWNGEAPSEITVRFDGRKLALGSPPGAGQLRFPLPEVDLEAGHFVTAELAFGDGAWAHAEATFGGRFGEEVLTELTALPVRLAEGKEDAPLDGCFELGGRRLEVAAVENGPADVLVVRDAGAESLLGELRLRGSVLTGGTARALMQPTGGAMRTRVVRDPELYRYEMRLAENDRMRFLWPNAFNSEHPRYGRMTLLDGSEQLTGEEGGVFWFMTRAYPRRNDGEQHLADAVAVAGLRAAANNRRRAVVLLVGQKQPADASVVKPAEVRRYLEVLQVPLHLWAEKPKNFQAAEWGTPTRVGSVERFEEAVDALRADLASQRVVFFDGRHAAAQIRVDAARCPHVARLDP